MIITNLTRRSILIYAIKIWIMKYSSKLKSPVRWTHGRHKIIQHRQQKEASEKRKKKIRKMTSRNQIIFKFVLRFLYVAVHSWKYIVKHEPISYRGVFATASAPKQSKRKTREKVFFRSRFEISLLPLWAQWSRLTILPAAMRDYFFSSKFLAIIRRLIWPQTHS